MSEQHRLLVLRRHRHCLLDPDRPIGEDVPKLGPVLAQHLPEQEPAVAPVGPPAAAEQREAMLTCAVKHALDRVLE